MPEQNYLFDIVVLLVAAVMVVSLVRRLKISSIVGYLLAGIIIGPYVLGPSNLSLVKHFAEFGVTFLLFNIGLELPWDRLLNLRRYVFGLGLLQVFVTTTIFSAIGWSYGLNLSTAIVTGGALSLSSTAIVLQILAEKEDLATKYGRISFAVLLFQDLIVVVFLILMGLIVQSSNLPNSDLLPTLLMAIAKGAAALLIIGFIGRFLLRPVYHWVARANNPELFVAMSILLIVTTGFLTYLAGLSMELGAFLAGVLMAGTEYRHQVEADIQPFKGLLLGLFFMSVGMDLNLPILWHNPLVVLTLVASLIFIKVGVLLATGQFFSSISWSTLVRLTLLLASGGEFAFVLLSPMIKSNLLSVSLGQELLLAVSLSMASTPALAYFGRKLSEKISNINGRNQPDLASQETADLQNHIIVVGFGSVGQTVGKLLSQQLIPYVAIDFNSIQVTKGRRQGLPVFFGDARRAEIFKQLGVDKARSIVVTLDRPGTISRCVMMLDRNFPNISLFVRAQSAEQADKLGKPNVKVIVPEMLEPSLQIAGAVMEAAGVPVDQVSKRLELYRKSITSTDEEALEETPSFLS